MDPVIWTAIGVVAAAVISFFTARYTSNLSHRAAVQTTKINATVEDKRVANETFKIITDGLREEVERLHKQGDEQRDQINKLIQRLNEMEERERKQKQLLEKHAKWDEQAVKAIKGANLTLSNPPPLTT